MDDLPFLTNLPGIGGRLKADYKHFIVSEMPEARDDMVVSATKSQGKHVYVTISREGQSTPQVQQALAVLFGVRLDEIGCAGLKDVHAVATQQFSLPRDRLPSEMRQPETALAQIADRLATAGWNVIGQPCWHQRKLKTGELAGNSFEIIVSHTDVPPAVAIERAQAIAAKLATTGFANYYGPQRFGRGGAERALLRGAALLHGRLGGPSARRHAQWLDGLLLSAFQSALFNAYLAARIRCGLFECLCVGDLVASPASATKPRMVRGKREQAWGDGEVDGGAGSVCDHGGDFACDRGAAPATASASDPDVSADEAAALRTFKISPLGPMFGGGAARSGGVPAALEAAIWEQHVPSLPLASVKRSVLAGGRRVCRLPLPADLEISAAPAASGLCFRFSLPRGAYATSLLREFMRCESDAAFGTDSTGDSSDGADGIDGDDGIVGIDGCDGNGSDHSVDIGDDAQAAATRPTAPPSLIPSLTPALTPPLVISQRGLRVTAEPAHFDKRAAREAMALLERLAADLSPHQGQQHADACHGARDGGLFSMGRVGNHAFVRFSEAAPDPVLLAAMAIDDAKRSAAAAPTVTRLVPVQATCVPCATDIAAAAEPLLAAALAARALDGVVAPRFAVRLREQRRGGNHGRSAVPLDRAQVFDALGAAVARLAPRAQVDLNAPDVVVLAEVDEALCCLGVLTRWSELHGYNLRSAGGKPNG